jgi:hypothetical protein
MNERHNGALHPTYRWYTFDRRISWRKFKLYYAESHNQQALLRFAVGVILLSVAYRYFIIAPRTLFGFAVVGLLALLAMRNLGRGIANFRRFYRADGMNHYPPDRRHGAPHGLISGWSPASITDGKVAVNAPVVLHDQTATPERVYAVTKQRRPTVGGGFARPESSNHEVVVHYLDGILWDVDTDGEGAVRSLAITDIHELTHWALDDEENEKLRDDHPQWDEVIGREVDYVTRTNNAIEVA